MARHVDTAPQLKHHVDTIDQTFLWAKHGMDAALRRGVFKDFRFVKAFCNRHLRMSTSFSGIDGPRVACDMICAAVQESIAQLDRALIPNLPAGDPLRPIDYKFIRNVELDVKCQMELQHASKYHDYRRGLTSQGCV